MPKAVKPPGMVGPMQSVRIQLFHLRANFRGMEYWTCPWCGNLNASQLFPDVYTISCTTASCRGGFFPARTYYPLPPGRPRIPQDWITPSGRALIDNMPLGEVNRDPYRIGTRVHRLYVPEMQRDLTAVERYLERSGVARESDWQMAGVKGRMRVEVEKMRRAVVEAQGEEIERFGRKK